MLVQNFTRDTLPKNLIFAQIHKSTKSMLLQYGDVVLVRDADIEMAISNVLFFQDKIRSITHLATHSH